MGRSVSVPSGAVVHECIDVAEYDSDTWDDFLEDARNVLSERFPSLSEESGWAGNEDRVILGNAHCRITVSEYCGVAAIALVPRAARYSDPEPLALAWCNRIARSFSEHLATRYPSTILRSMGAASNGETFYRRPAGADGPGSLGMGMIVERGERI